MAKSDDIIGAARSMLATPFMHQGRLPRQALDCAGLVVAVARALGLPHNDCIDYGRTPHAGLLEATLDGQPCLVRVPRGERQPGDVLLMRFRAEPQHLAILAGDTIIHTWETVGEVVEHTLTPTWSERIVRVYRFVEAPQ